MTQRFLLLIPAAFLAACASAPPPAAPSAPSVAPPPSRSGGALERMLQVTGPAGATQQEVERALGPPDLRRQEGQGAMLTYRMERCALLLVFAAPSAGGERRLAEARGSARQPGGAPPSMADCAGEAADRRRGR